MLHTIARGPRREGGVVDLLLECHGRIRKFSNLAVAIAERDDVPPEEVATVCADVERYFTLALPLHVRDEEESLLPRLYGRDAEVDRALAAMASQHVEHGALISRLVALAAALHADPARLAELAGDLAAVAVPLERELAAHLEHEETVVFPAIARLLDAAAQAAVVGEIAARRSSAVAEP